MRRAFRILAATVIVIALIVTTTTLVAWVWNGFRSPIRFRLFGRPDLIVELPIQSVLHHLAPIALLVAFGLLVSLATRRQK
jgi:hypothetical protein